MSKKSKRQKLKKKLRAMLRAQMAQAEHKQEEKIPQKVEKAEPKKEIIEKPASTKEEAATPQIKKETLTQKLNPYFTYDIRKVFISVGASLVLIIGVTMISKYTNWLSLISEKLFSFLHLG